MRFSLTKLFVFLCLAISAGCRYVDVDKCADGSWHAKYYSYGLWTTLGSLEVNVTTNGIAHLKMSDLGSDVSTNHVTIVDSTGKIVAEITGKVVEHIVK